MFPFCLTLLFAECTFPVIISDISTLGSVSVSRSHHFRSIEAAITRLPWGCDLYRIRFSGNAASAHQETEGSPLGCGRRRGTLNPTALSSKKEYCSLQEEEKRGGKKGRLLGIITLSDVLRYTIGEPGIGEVVEKDGELPTSASSIPTER